MVHRKIATRKPVKKVQPTVSKKISLVHKMGPYGTTQEALHAKRIVLSKVKHAKFGAFTKSSREISFLTKTSYTVKVSKGVSSAAIKAHIQAQSQGAVVKVS